MKARLSVQEMLDRAARMVGLVPYRRDSSGKLVKVPAPAKPKRPANSSGNGAKK